MALKTSSMIASGASAAAFALAVALGTAAAQAPASDPHHPAGAAQAPAAAPAPAQAPQGPPAAPGMMGSGEMGHMMQMMQRMMAARGAAGGGPGAMRPFERIEGQLAYYRTELRITEAQTPQWNAFADAMRAAAARLRQAYVQALQAAGSPATAPEQLERRIAMYTVLLETTRSAAEAMRPLYAVLSEEQKRTADELLAEHLQDMRARGM